MKKKYGIAAIILIIGSVLCAKTISVQKNDKGWRLLDGTKEVEVKGVVWAYTPIGETFSYDLWSKSDEFIQRMIDTDMILLKAMGVNAIRCFYEIPPKWVEYIYTKYGIYSIVNNMLGRYGITVRGTWYPNTDYSDLYTRETLIAMAKETAEKFRGVNGVLMYMFGNESNYGLVWSTTEIENLPVGEQNTLKAGYLYSVLEEAMKVCKEIDPDRPVGIVNGDTQYLELIKTLCPSLEIFGVNAYRGYKFYDSFYENIADILDKPVMLTEAGADAYNAVRRQEDQYAQMAYLQTQWEEIYQQAYGKGRSQNVIGGFVFEWIDEWWKQFQNKELDIHNENGTWANSGYDLDYRDDVNNMNEEWFGICAQSKITDRGIHRRIPRAAYYMLADAWKLSLYNSTNQEIEKTFASLNTGLYLANGNEQSIKETLNEKKFVTIDKLDVSVYAVTPVSIQKLGDAINSGKSFKEALNYKGSDDKVNKPHVSAETSLGLTIRPFENFSGSVLLKAWTDEPYTNLAEANPRYYKKGDESSSNPKNNRQLQYVDVYAASFNYTNPYFDLNGYYHTGHGNFETSGDVFNIARECWYMEGVDKYGTWGSKAPIAAEFIGKETLKGLTVIGGPEIWDGAPPQLLINYFHVFSKKPSWLSRLAAGLTYTEEFGSSVNINFDPYNGFGSGRKASLYGEAGIAPWVTLKLGLLHAGSEKVGAQYTSTKGTTKKITYADTLGGYMQAGTNMFQHLYIYTNVLYRGLAAETNPETVRGSFFTGDAGSGNRFEVQVGADAIFGDFVIRPIIRARTPLERANGRSLLKGSPFIVDSFNREALEVEAVFTYDPEGATWYHEWNNNDVEGANFAVSLTGKYTLFAGRTDIIPFKSDTWNKLSNADGSSTSDYVWYDSPAPLPLQWNLWQIGTRIVSNPLPDMRIIGTAGGGCLGSVTGTYEDRPEKVYFANMGIAARYGHWIGSFNCQVNTWGQEYWWKYFNRIFPFQYVFDAAYSFKPNPSFIFPEKRIGIKIAGRTFGKHSADPYGALPKGATMDGSSYMELTAYFNIGL